MLCKILFTMLIPIFGVCSAPLNFGSSPMVIPDSEIYPTYVTPSVASSSVGFSVCWQGANVDNNFIASTTKNFGFTWTSNTPVASESIFPHMAGNTLGLVATWYDVSGFNDYYFSTFYGENSTIWGPFQTVTSPTLLHTTVFAGASPTKFIATWSDYPNQDIYAGVTGDGTNWVVNRSPLGTNVSNDVSTPCGNNNLLIVAWKNSTTGAIYVASSSDSGNNWGSPQIAISVAGGGHHPLVSSFANQDGFLLVYADSSYNLWSIFSRDAVSWSSPSLIATGLFEINYLIPAVGGTDDGFVVAWIDASYNAYASFSADNGLNWSMPNLIASGDIQANDLHNISISAYRNHCMAVWVNHSNEVVFNVSLFPYHPNAKYLYPRISGF